jgi:hypothetical protein
MIILFIPQQVLDKDKHPSALLVRPMAQKSFHCAQKSPKMRSMEEKTRHYVQSSVF